MSKAFDRFASAMIGLAALAVAVSVVHKTFFSVTPTSRLAPVFFEQWDPRPRVGKSFYGSPEATVHLVVLSDFECPACAGFHKSLAAYLSEHPKDIEVVYVPYPLSYHEHARPAALVAECLEGSDQLRAWSDSLFAGQDSIGRKPLSRFLYTIGVRDTQAVLACANGRAAAASVDAGLEFGKSVQLAGTPTTLVNGWRSPVPVTPAELDRAIRNVKRGSPPFAAEK
jgi:protein-disulfide isomerase